MLRRALTASIVAIALAVLPSLASAATHRGAILDARVPSAQLQARGTGTILVQGRLLVNGAIRRGTVVVIDRAGDAQVRMRGRVVRFRGHRAIVRRARGILYVTGSRVTVRIRGRGLRFSIAGHGRVLLRGRGVYRLNSGPVRRWGHGWMRLAPPGPRPHPRPERGHSPLSR